MTTKNMARFECENDFYSCAGVDLEISRTEKTNSRDWVVRMVRSHSPHKEDWIRLKEKIVSENGLFGITIYLSSNRNTKGIFEAMERNGQDKIEVYLDDKFFITPVSIFIVPEN